MPDGTRGTVCLVVNVMNRRSGLLDVRACVRPLSGL